MDVADKAARGAGKILLDKLGEIKEVEFKARNSLLTQADTESEELIIKIIKSHFPAHRILAEESGRHSTEDGNSDFLWIIDPLDGTTNYTHSYPFFAVSIALEVEGVVKLGLVYDPVKDEMFRAAVGQGAYLNGERIRVSDTKDIENGNLCTGFIHTTDRIVEENLRHFENFIWRSRAVRRDGSAALDLCYVACGRYDGFWEIGLNPWDTAAGFLIAEEAGGKVTDFSGNKFGIYGEETLASNGIIHGEMIDVLSLGRGGDLSE